jgi:ribokinase
MSKKTSFIGRCTNHVAVQTERLPKPGEMAAGGPSVYNRGGPLVDQAISASLAGAQVSVISRLGNDIFSAQLRPRLQRHNIQTEGLIPDPDQPSELFLSFNAKKSDSIRACAFEKVCVLQPSDIEATKSQLQKATVLVVHLNIPMETLLALKYTVKSSTTVIVQPMGCPRMDADLIAPHWILSLTGAEAELWTGIKMENVASIHQAIAAIQSFGMPRIVLWMNREQVYWTDKSAIQCASASRATSLDEDSSRHVFQGALATALADHKTLDQSVAFAQSFLRQIPFSSDKPSAPRTSTEIESYLIPKTP